MHPIQIGSGESEDSIFREGSPAKGEELPGVAQGKVLDKMLREDVRTALERNGLRDVLHDVDGGIRSRVDVDPVRKRLVATPDMKLFATRH